MSYAEKDYSFAKRLSLDILRQLEPYAGDNTVFLHPGSEKKAIGTGKSKFKFEAEQEVIDNWDEWFEAVFEVLYEEKLITPRPMPNSTYLRVITEDGKLFLLKSENEQKGELDRMWKTYAEEMDRFSAPITTDEYVKVIRSWLDPNKKFPPFKRARHNAQRFLAELYYSQDKSLSFNDLNQRTKSPNVRGQAKAALERHLGMFFGKHLGRPKKGYKWMPHLFLKDNKLLPNFREALKIMDGNGEINIKEWGKYSILNPQSPLPVIPVKTKSVEPPFSPQPTNPIIEEIDTILAFKKQVILYGAPGTGKTYMANEYVRYKTDTDKNVTVKRCTFHPEYGYEHFIEGYRPAPKDGVMLFEYKPGIFKELCDKAKQECRVAKKAGRKRKKFYLIIDEINRGDIPRIFGELITLIEADKRKWSKRTTLPLSGDDFCVPPNVYIIATMNTADRSIALLDTALRRRFGFLEMKPEYHHFKDIKLGERLKVKDKDGKLLASNLAEWFESLNKELQEKLQDSRHDVEHILIGHSYFFGLLKEESAEQIVRFEQVIKHEFLPLIQEYCYEDKKVYAKLVAFITETTGISMNGESVVSLNKGAVESNGGEEP